MHLPNHFVSDPVNVTSGIIALSALAYSARRVSLEKNNLMLMAAIAAFVFAAQMLNFPINGGTSGHFLGAAAVAALLGPWSALIVLSCVLTIQSVFFADGGLMALGSNIVNMGIVGGVMMYPFMRLLRSKLPESSVGFAMSVALISWFSVVAASLACSLELALSGTIPLGVVLPAMVETHALIGVGEATITTAVVMAVAASHPDLMPSWTGFSATKRSTAPTNNAWKLTGAGVALALALAIFASPYASGYPDGLDKTAIDHGFEQSSTEDSINPLAFFPDYKVEAIASEDVSTALAGLIGTLMTFTFAFAAMRIIKASKPAHG